ncbi:MAG: flippase-like domain-containing protein [Rhodospirillaceae bacterium]|nr:flippase-like domain-containing protein [Rhodospirillaceae bacterium]
MRFLNLVYLLLGLALFATVLSEFDFGRAVELVWRAGLLGLLVIVALHLVAATFDVLHSLVVMRPLPITLRWVLRFFRVRLVSEAMNLVVPAGGFGGEPLKAALLKQHYQVSFHNSSIGIALARITGLLAQLLFVALALPIMEIVSPLPENYEHLAWGGLGVLALMAAGFIVLFKGKLASRLGRVLNRSAWGAKIGQGLRAVEPVEDEVNAFLTTQHKPMAIAIGLGAMRTAMEVAEIYLALQLLGHPVSWSEAMVAEGLIQLACTVGFFIPANIGTQDGVMTIVIGAFVGVPAVGLGAALLRRVRELIMVGAGFAIGSHYTWSKLRPQG